MPYRRPSAALGFCLLATTAHAGHHDFSHIGRMTQQDFRLLSEDLGAAFSYKPVAPVEALGITGFDAGVELTATRLAHTLAYRQASGGSGDMLYLPKLHLHKGLPFGVDVGASYSEIPGGGIRLIGAEVRYALVQGGVAIPAIGVRASYSALKGADTFDLTTRGIDLSVSKGFAMLTPYAGIGTVWTSSAPDSSTGLRRETFSQHKYFVGTNINLLLLNVALEADRTGDTTSYSAKVGWRW
jgi:hypothetical protein